MCGYPPDKHVSASLRPAWQIAEEDCDARVVGRLDDSEKTALDKAGLASNDKRTVERWYGICAQSGMDAWNQLDDPDMRPVEQDEVYEEAEELRDMLRLCPDHPDGDTIPAYLSKALDEDYQDYLAQPPSFDDGIYLVGDEVEPGTYVSEGAVSSATGCYWERTDSPSGNIIDNYFSQSSLRRSVTISTGDYSFSTQGCGEWVKQ